jgi:hypothetical protein
VNRVIRALLFLKRLRIWNAILLALAVAIYANFGWALSDEIQASANEYSVKAAFLLNFIKFINWPEGAFEKETSPIVIGVIGDEKVCDALKSSLQGRTINRRDLLPLRITWPDEIHGYHILFVCSSESKVAPAVVKSLENESILTVGETEGFGRQGGMINFYLEKNKVRFEINLNATDKAHIKISSQLLSLARIIEGKPQAGRN